MKRRLWRLVDKALAQLGLIRVQLVPRIEVMERDRGPRYVKIEFANGHRVSGYLESGSGIIKYGANPLIPR